MLIYYILYIAHIIEELLSEYVVAGSYYLKLREFSKYFALSHKHGGLVLKVCDIYIYIYI